MRPCSLRTRLVGAALLAALLAISAGFALTQVARIASTPVASTPPPRSLPTRGSAYAGGTTLYAVTVELSWIGPNGTQSFALDTRRLGPATAARP